ncbi:hypothetical protein BO99DRAFT_414905 [Aspergillus violaceofuscus CBS 115571]|uniref:G domain-containing protein n=1 Tax=Aspergillus violaceofuscus (strain CBS 115571) TaxID=1450538 RepID=A0A2V5HXQ9_ASPV1|nr:hypothetical protein BO99DRAFT_414905 [Aspergillus violaceofuscus CBS 115571]
MFNLISRVRTFLGDQPASPHPWPKVAILGLPDAGKRALLQHLSDTPVDPITVAGCHAGWTSSSHALGLNFIAADVGLDARSRWRAAVAARYTDADAVIIVVNPAHAIALEELRYQLGCLVNGMEESGEVQTYCIVRKGIPWLVLVNCEGSAVVRDLPAMREMQGSRLMVWDWMFRSISTMTGEGVEGSMLWLKEKTRVNAERRLPAEN